MPLKVRYGMILALFCNVLATAGGDRTARRAGPMEGSSGSTEGGRRWPTRRAISWERSPLRVHHINASSVVTEMTRRFDGAATDARLDRSVPLRSIRDYCILLQLRSDGPRYVFGRRCNGESEW